jgi:anhydro-N-acetylmuramic acid kinase
LAHSISIDADILICGGGRQNQFLMKVLSHCLDKEVKRTEDFGIDGDFLEAGLCAWIAF